MKNAVDFEKKMTQFVIDLRFWLKEAYKMNDKEAESWIEVAIDVFEKKGYVPSPVDAIIYLKKWFDFV